MTFLPVQRPAGEAADESSVVVVASGSITTDCLAVSGPRFGGRW
jgi:hypothetical protein